MKTVFITGADRGIGFALCEQFALHGWRVLAGRYMPDWTELDGLVRKYPGQILCIPLDVGNTESVKAAVRQASAVTAQIDVLVNCAGIYGKDEKSGFEAAYQINSVGPLRMVGEFLPLMQAGMKRLCFVSSESGSITLRYGGGEGNTAYCTSKAMLNMAVKLLFNELHSQGYTFRLYHPGWVKSYMSGKKSDRGTYEPEDTAITAFEQFTDSRSWEDVLVMMDVENELWSF